MDTFAAHDDRRPKRLTDLLESIRGHLRTRLDELRPLVREYERLRAADAALADGSSTSGQRAGQPKRGRAQARQGGAGRGVAGRGGAGRTRSRRRTSSSTEREVNREKVLALVRER